MKKFWFIIVFVPLVTGCASSGSTEEQQEAVEVDDPFLTSYFAIVDALIQNDYKAVQEAGAQLNKAEQNDGVTLALTRMGKMIAEAPSSYQQRMVLYQMGIVIPLYIERNSLHDYPIYKFSCKSVLDGKEGIWFSRNKESKDPYAEENKSDCVELIETIEPVKQQ